MGEYTRYPAQTRHQTTQGKPPLSTAALNPHTPDNASECTPLAVALLQRCKSCRLRYRRRPCPWLRTRSLLRDDDPTVLDTPSFLEANDSSPPVRSRALSTAPTATGTKPRSLGYRHLRQQGQLTTKDVPRLILGAEEFRRVTQFWYLYPSRDMPDGSALGFEDPVVGAPHSSSVIHCSSRASQVHQWSLARPSWTWLFHLSEPRGPCLVIDWGVQA